MIRRCLCALIALTSVAAMRAQPPTADTRPMFEAASIRPNGRSNGFQGGSCGGTDARPPGALAQMAGVKVTPPPPDACQFTNTSLQMLMGAAYQFGLPFTAGPAANSLAGAPPWFNSAYFDVLAKAAKPTTNAQLTLMLQRMLEDRFALTFHRETREADGYALVVAPGGPTMTRGTAIGGRIGRFPPRPWAGTNVAMPELAQFLATRLGKPVTDATGLAGGYTFTLTWTPGDGERSGVPTLPPGVGPGVPAEPQDGPSLMTALQEQLGLRLERRRVPTDVLVIDSAKLPSAD